MGARSQTVGPYTLEKRLGAGGMGEVYQAYDRRLDRWVAIKLIRPEYTENATARERFRREARAAARLSHPAIVQIYDIVESEESDAIVLELVEGEPLSRRIAHGPLPVEEAVRLGRQTAEGLAAAHARGIIHRDLKAENVMVTLDGHAKILDFGLAKRLEGEASLTEDHRVVGTFRSMSPEQALGLPLDHRSDLFSLGVLLYEMLSGRSPFQGGSTLETLTRICQHQQAPLRELDPAIPEPLSSLVDHLLAKDPVLRPGSALEISAVLDNLTGQRTVSFQDVQDTLLDGPLVAPGRNPQAVEPPASSGGPVPQAARPSRKLRWALPVLGAVVLMLAVVFRSRLMPAGEPLYVVVPKPVVVSASEPSRADLLAASLRLSLLRGLLDLEGVSTLPPEQVDEASGPPMAVARAMAAQEVISSRLSCNAATCRISLNRIRGQDGSLLWTESFEVPVDQPYLLADAVGGQIQRCYGDYRRKSRARPLEVRREDYTEYLRLRREFDSKKQGLPVDELLDRVTRLRGSSPHFLEAYVFESDILRYRFVAGRDSGDLERAFAILDQARALDASDPRPLLALFETALVSERLDRAEEALRDLERLQPGEPEVSIQRARLTERKGDPERALALFREAAQRHPSWKNLIRLADMEYRLGESAAARQHLIELLQRLPDYYQALSLLAQIELLSGRAERAAEIYEGLVRRSPQMPELTNLGLAYMVLRRYPEAQGAFMRVLELDPDNPLLVLNMADVGSLSGDRSRAESLYLKLLDLTERDPAAGNWQIRSIRAQALAHLGRRREAAEAAQKVVALAPGNAQAAYEVSLVYTLIGDQASALASAVQALEQGVEPVWFSFPWFDALRASSEFKDAARRAEKG